MGGMRFVICDVFTDRPLAGNQLAVFTDAQGIPEHLLQPLAREINLSRSFPDLGRRVPLGLRRESH